MFLFFGVDVRKCAHVWVLSLSEGSVRARCLCLSGRGNASQWSPRPYPVWPCIFRVGKTGGECLKMPKPAKGSGLPLVMRSEL